MVNIDTVYQRVLALANKEQRGYITPQEFNLFANQAQMDIFDQYFYDINQRERIPGNNNSHADISTLLEEKIDTYFKSTALTATNQYKNIFDIPTDCYKISEVRYVRKNPSGGLIRQEVERVTYKQFNLVRLSPLTAPTVSRPIYYQRGNRIVMNPDSRNPEFLSIYNGIYQTVNIGYIRKPNKANWAYVIVGDKAMYNPSASDHANFDLHASEETKLVVKILGLAGVTLKDPSLYQVAAAEDNKNIQQEKQ